MSIISLSSPGRGDDFLCAFYVSVPAVVDHAGPARGNDSPCPGSADGGRGVDAARPVRDGEPLVVTVLEAGIHDHGGAFGRVAVLVGVGRDGGHAGHREVERGQREASVFHEGNQETT